jgi:heat shock protein HtpX
VFRYVRLKPGEVSSHRLANTLQSVVLFGGMLLFLALIGYLLSGLGGVVWALGLGLLSFAFSKQVAPLLVLRLYRARVLTAQTAPELYDLVDRLAERAELEAAPTLFYVPSAMLNAFALMYRGAPIIGVTDGLLRSLSGRELAGVLAHEIGHIRNQDLTVMGLADAISRLTHSFSVVGQIMLLVSLPLYWVSDAPVPWLTIVLLMAAPTFNSLLQLALSRTREFDADLEAVRLTGDPEGYVSALQKIEYQGAGFLERIFFPGRREPSPSLLRTHPETGERIARIRSMVEVYSPRLSLRDIVDWLPVRLARVQRPPGRRWGGMWY